MNPTALTRTRHRIGRPREAPRHTTGTLPVLSSPHPPLIPRFWTEGPISQGYGLTGLSRGDFRVQGTGSAGSCGSESAGRDCTRRPGDLRDVASDLIEL
jgi:hypothetical protein